MLDASVRTRIRSSIDAEIAPRERALGIALRDEQSRAAAHGALGGSRSALMLASVGRDELAVRSDIIWASIKRAHLALGKLEDTTLDDLRLQIDEFLTEQVALITRTVADRIGDQSQGSMVEKEISTRARELRNLLDVEVQYYLDGLREVAAVGRGEQLPAGRAAILNFHGPVGAVQTGAHATAHVSMAGADGERLRAAVEAFVRAVEENSEIASERREQALDLLNDVATATKAAKPNAPKIAALLSGVGTVVRTVGSLRPAYEALRSVATVIGFHLP